MKIRCYAVPQSMSHIIDIKNNHTSGSNYLLEVFDAQDTNVSGDIKDNLSYSLSTIDMH